MLQPPRPLHSLWPLQAWALPALSAGTPIFLAAASICAWVMAQPPLPLQLFLPRQECLSEAADGAAEAGLAFALAAESPPAAGAVAEAAGAGFFPLGFFAASLAAFEAESSGLAAVVEVPVDGEEA